MDLHCPATVICLAPGETVPAEVGGQRVVAIYHYLSSDPNYSLDIPIYPAPPGNFWRNLPAIVDMHRGEGIGVLMSDEKLNEMGLVGAALSVDSNGPQRINL